MPTLTPRVQDLIQNPDLHYDYPKTECLIIGSFDFLVLGQFRVQVLAGLRGNSLYGPKSLPILFWEFLIISLVYWASKPYSTYVGPYIMTWHLEMHTVGS